jgi:hypothetical protein
VPSIINWNVHHYAAITGEENGRYEVNDMTFGSDGGATVMTRKAIDAESSGYFLVPAKVAAATQASGWRSVNAHSDEAKTVYGKGMAPSPWPGLACDCGTVGQFPQAPGSPSNTQTPYLRLMTVARRSPITASLHLEDAPVGYRPQIGVPSLDAVSYNSPHPFRLLSLGYGGNSLLRAPSHAQGWECTVSRFRDSWTPLIRALQSRRRLGRI